jgi:hypothetical protein
MSRSGYVDGDDYDQWATIKWRGVVASATRGKRGQQFFRDLLAALDAMPVKELIRDELETETGAVCAIGALGKARGVDMKGLDPEDSERVSATFDIARQLACEVVYMNDEAEYRSETPSQRWERMRAWVASQIKP